MLVLGVHGIRKSFSGDNMLIFIPPFFPLCLIYTLYQSLAFLVILFVRWELLFLLLAKYSIGMKSKTSELFTYCSPDSYLSYKWYNDNVF